MSEIDKDAPPPVEHVGPADGSPPEAVQPELFPPEPPPEPPPPATAPEPPLSGPPPSGPPPSAPAPPAPVARPRKRRHWFRRLVVALLMVAVVLPVVSTLVYRVAPPPATILMLERLAAGYGLHKTWRPISAMSPSLPQAVIAAEDAQFCSHHGFDFAAMRKAALNNERRPGRIRGGSTISQQTAKNVFLWPDRSYVRKGLEAYFTVLIEALWGKRRILEVYLNVVEWGPGTYGAEAAAQRYFHVGAAQLTGPEAARLAAVLPSPLRWKPVASGPYVARRSRRIGAAAATVREDDLAACAR